jgi:urease alpha subunit
MGQASNTRNDVALDTVITNVVIIDAVLGIIKADLGIKVNLEYLLIYLNK